MLTKHSEFDWDDVKADENLHKHGVDFAEDAAPLLLYPLGEIFYVEDYDSDHSDQEARWITYGPQEEQEDSILRIVWTSRLMMGRVVTRLITARQATPRESKDYAKVLTGRMP